MPGVDVIIPCYNYAHLLSQCVESVLSQDVDQIRVIIIDNASADDSVGVARRLAAQDDRITVVCHAENVGSHGSFNEGIDLAEADYLMILCADDILAPGALRTGKELLERNPAAAFVLGSPEMAPWSNGIMPVAPKQTGGQIIPSEAFIKQCCRAIGVEVTAHAMLVRTSAQRLAGHYRFALPLMDDLEMALRLACQGDVVALYAPLVITGVHSNNISKAMWHDRLRDLSERAAVFDSFFAREGRALSGAERLHREVRQRLAAYAFWSGLSHLVRGRRADAWELFRFATSVDPRRIPVPPIAHLLRTPGALRRATAVLAEAFVRR